MINLPEFEGKAKKFAPIYVKEEERCENKNKSIYTFYEINGYTQDGNISCIYVMKEPCGLYTIVNERYGDWHFQNNEQRTFSIISRDEFYKEFNNVLTKIKDGDY